MKKLKCIKLANAIKTGKGEMTFVSGEYFDIALHSNVVVSVHHRPSGHTVHTSLFNAIYWEQEPEAEGQPEPQKRGPGRPPKSEA